MTELKNREDYSRSGLYSVIFEITYKCNQNCAHCYLGDREPIELDTKIIFNALNECKALGVKSIVITGGEPTLHKNWRDIVKYALENNFSLQLETTNTEILKGKDINLLRKIDEIHLSIDAPPGRDSVIRTPEYNNNIFEFAKKLKSGGCNPFFFCTLHKRNLQFVDELVDGLKRVEVPIRFNILTPEGRASRLKNDLFFSKQEIKDIFVRLYEEYRKGRIMRTRLIYQCLVDPQFQEACRNSERPISGGCIAGIASCDITPNGDVIPCPHLRLPVGNLHKETLTDIWFNAPTFNLLRDRSNLKGKCGICEYRPVCGGCRGAAYRTTGDISESDPICFKEVL